MSPSRARPRNVRLGRSLLGWSFMCTATRRTGRGAPTKAQMHMVMWTEAAAEKAICARKEGRKEGEAAQRALEMRCHGASSGQRCLALGPFPVLSSMSPEPWMSSHTPPPASAFHANLVVLMSLPCGQALCCAACSDLPLGGLLCSTLDSGLGPETCLGDVSLQ